MKKSINKIVIVVSVVLIVLLVVGYLAVNGITDGFIDYQLWKIFSKNSGKGAYARINDINMYYEIHGKGEPLLLLHGGTAFIDSFYKQIPVLAKKFRVITPESRGHGRTNDSGKPLSYSLMTSDVLRLMDHLNIDSAYIVGWSDGGIIGLHLAINHPKRVRKLFLIGVNYHTNGLIEKLRKEIEEPSGKLYDPNLRIMYKLLSPHPEQWDVFIEKVKTMWLMQPNFTVNDLCHIKAPTMILVGEHDDIKPDHSRQMHKAIPGAELIIVPGASHLVPIEKPNIVNNAILSFLLSP